MDQFPKELFVDVYFPELKPMTQADMKNMKMMVSERIGGRTFLTTQEAKNMSIHNHFIMQIKDPKKKNILIRIFWSDILMDFTALPYDLNKKETPLTNKFLFYITPANCDDPQYKITSWKKSKELKSFDIVKKYIMKNNKNLSEEEIYNLFSKSKYAPSYDIKMYGTPMTTQLDHWGKYNLLQIVGHNKYIKYGFGDSGIAHVHPKTYKIGWDCY